MRSLLLILVALSTNAIAQLRWENLEQKVTAGATDQFVVAKYQFTNTGNYPVTIIEVQPSCGCTTVQLAKKEYAPGESGELAARFDIAGRSGRQEKSIVILTKDTINQPITLRLLVTIPEAVRIEPEVLFWRLGDEPKPKVIRVTVAEDFPAKIVSIKSNSSEMRVDLKDLTPKKEVEVTVTPQNPGQPATATLIIKTDYPVENRATYYAWAQVR
ncbi:MAG: DUF1573 domain-containing protein [Chthoniobacterales bacterium]|jgi:hypothetical protein